MRAIFFLISSNSPRVRPNWRRVLAWWTARRRQVLAAPVQLAPKVTRPKSRTVKASFKPFPGAPRMLPFGTSMSRKASRAVAVPRTPSFSMRGSRTTKPGMSGVTRNAVMAVSFLPGTGVRAMTVSTCAMAPLVM